MRRIISALLFSFSSALALAQGAQPLQLAEGAPDRYIVAPGDTLWGIAAKFLKDPYRWPELWKLNADEIKNPQRIYPGQVISLDRSGGQPRLQLSTINVQRREYVESLVKAIPAIEPQVIEPFLSEPRIVEADGFANAPRVVAIEGNRVLSGAGDTIYTTEPKEKHKLWQIFRPGKELKDPDSGETLGFEAVYLGNARQLAEGVPATFQIGVSRMEVMRDDRLMPAPRQDVPTYIPRAPDKKITGRVLSMYSGVSFSGPQQILTINRGKNDGVEPGHVLAVDKAGQEVANRFEGFRTDYKLPDNRNGLIYVFRSFDRLSYALVMNAVQPIVVGDTVRTP
jgi:LysM repeat protein